MRTTHALSAADDAVKHAILDHARAACDNADASVDGLAELLAGYYRHVPTDELAGREPADLAGAVLAHRRLAGTRQPGETIVAVHDPDPSSCGWSSSATVVEIVTDDMPFLVDSVTAEIARHGYDMRLAVHPQLLVERGADGELVGVRTDLDPDHVDDGADPAPVTAESWMHLELEPLPSAQAHEQLVADLRRVLADVRAAVEDWRRMRATAVALADELVQGQGGVDHARTTETADLLRWLAEDHFTFLGYREYVLADVDGEPGIRPVDSTGLGILREAPSTPQKLSDWPDAVRERALTPDQLIVTKANSRSTVHRPGYLDYVGIKTLDEQGRVTGEHRFIGLWSSSTYLDSVRVLPVVRRKVEAVLAWSGFSSRSHDGKDLLSILETYPHDELFQTSTEDLYRIAMGVLALQDRRQLRLFLRRDDYHRFWSCLVYLPRDRWNTAVRLKMQRVLLKRLRGSGIEFSTWVTEDTLARLHFVVRTPASSEPEADVDAAELTAELTTASRTWDEGLAAAMADSLGADHTAAMMARWSGALPEAYKEDFTVSQAVTDLRRLEMLEDDDDLAMSLYAPTGAAADERRFKIFRVGDPMSLSDVLPMFSSLGVQVSDERPYHVRRPDGQDTWIYDFGLKHVSEHAKVERVSENFQNAFAAAWRGDCDVDGFNALVLAASLSWRQVTVVRSYAKYLRQTGTLFTQSYIERATVASPHIAALLVRLFETRFDPAFGDGRADAEEDLARQITDALEQVQSLDFDRILRSLLGLVRATVRTSYFQRASEGRSRSHVSFKLQPHQIPELPKPLPQHEIWVCGPRVEGVHLRFGAVARGGLRWSDRLQDFRTEILGLVKAQMVKNVVIVPVGSKGGFVVKRPPAGGSRDQVQAEGIACYTQFVSGLLDITDNIVGGQVVPPRDVVRHDGDDPYLVVAADKGTATFSDVANDVSQRYGYWLGDAFASGGSVGYDHKAMGITAKGAWESVKHHFRELGLDTQNHDFTVAGIGDMSGDVFGNGMLLSPHIRLVAAFDHRHIFLDPTPDAATSFAERRRLFELPRSSWDDYDKGLLSAGGGVFSRSAKSVPITPEVQAALDLPPQTTRMTPNDLLHAILLSPVDLLWNGGIGTYVKAAGETDAEVGDKANDGIRVDGGQLRCKVVGEGGNLGLTQRGRIEYALAGGAINTDAIDNSAGVDTSDHEVNIKILLGMAVESGRITTEQRNTILASMTDEVERLVLRDNYEQNLVLGTSRAQADRMLTVEQRLIKALERAGHLDRGIEFLPDDKTIAARQDAGTALTSPELAVLLAYVKIVLEADIVASSLPDDAWFDMVLVDYFPTPLRTKFHEEMAGHRLRRELITTAVVNDLVNRGGITFCHRTAEETGSAPADIARTYVVTREIFGLKNFWADVEALDHTVDTETQVRLVLESRRLLDRTVRWLLQNRRHPIDIDAEIAYFSEGIGELAPRLPELLVASERERLQATAGEFVDNGVPRELALRAAALLDGFSLVDVVELARERKVPAATVADVYFTLSERFGIDRLLSRISQLPRDDRWNALARSALRYDLYAALAELTGEVLDIRGAGDSAEERITAWADANRSSLERAQSALDEMPDTIDLATLSVVLRQVRTMVRTTVSPAS